jgi:hypothetical protein
MIMYTIEQIQTAIRVYMRNARVWQLKRNEAQAALLEADYEEYEILCREAVQQARKWHSRLLEQYGIAPPSVWLNEAIFITDTI